MLLNATHELTFSGLAPDVLDAYVRYKKGTRAIVNWLCQNASFTYRKPRSLSLTSLTELSCIVCDRGPQLPGDVDFYFRETIHARRYLSKHFRKHEGGESGSTITDKHEYFTNSLEKIYSELCQCCGSPNHQCRTNGKSTDTEGVSEALANRFTLLEIKNAEEKDQQTSNSVSCRDCSDSDIRSCPSPQQSLILQDDDLSVAIEIANMLSKVGDLLTSVFRIWSEAMENNLPIIVPAALSNHAWNLFKTIEAELSHSETGSELLVLHSKVHLLDDLSTSGQASTSVPNWHVILNQLLESWQIIEHHRKDHAKSDETLKRRPSSARADSCTCGLTTRREIMHAMMEASMKYISSDNVTASTPIDSDPGRFIGSLRDLQEQRESRPSQLRLSFMLLLQAESHLLYFKHQRMNPRLTTLRYASSIAQSLKALLLSQPPSTTSTFPCRCPQTLAFHLAVLYSDLSKFLRTPNWDIHSQSPYTCGTQLLDIVHRTTYYGHRILRYRNFVGAAVHVYNVLRATGALANDIPILEALCEDMTSFFFTSGQRPRKTPFKAYVRFLGGRIKFKNSHKGNDHRHSWCMAIPGHAAKRSSGLGQGLTRDKKQPSDEEGGVDSDSLLLQLVNNDYTLDAATINHICRREPAVKSCDTPTSKRASTGSHSHSRHVQCPIPTSSPPTALSSLQHALTAELAPPGSPPRIHPTALDPFTLYAASVSFVEKVCAADPEIVASHDPPPSDGPCRCLCWVEPVFVDAETFRVRREGRAGRRGERGRAEGGGKGREKGRDGGAGGDGAEDKDKTGLLDLVGRALVDVFGGEEEGDGEELRGWTWSMAS